MTIAIQHARLIDGTGTVQDRATLLVRGTKILAAGPSNEVKIPKGAVRIDARVSRSSQDSSLSCPSLPGWRTGRRRRAQRI